MRAQKKIHLSIVATSRNDDHGKNLLYRMQSFIDGFVQQCKRHKLRAELILVEWNPPAGTLPLSKVLKVPDNKGPCTVRIIQVPPETHMQLDHADRLPLFQMIGKNVGIRRALGKFVLATNIDILFSDEIISFIKNKLKSGHVYRVDRLDVPEKLPNSSSFKDLLYFCSKNFFRINGKLGTELVVKKSKWRIFLLFRSILMNSFRQTTCFAKKILYSPLVHLFTKSFPCLSAAFFSLKHTLKKRVRWLLCTLFPKNPLVLHTNACGDFTLLSAEDWAKLKGYPEWNIFSWHIDSILLYQAKQHGIKELDLPRRMPIYHIEHETGSGYSAEGAQALFNRLHANGIPYLSDSALKELVTELKNSQEKVVYNSDDWGMAGLSFKEWVF